MTTTVPPDSNPDSVDSKGLKSGALGLVSSVVVGVASTAPAYSLAASLGFIVVGGTLAAGVHAPGIVLLAFIPMYLIAVAYQELNKAEPDCGTTFTWAARAFGPITGWMGGWGIIVADVIVMSNLAQIAGSYTFTFIGGFGLPGVAALANNEVATLIAGLLWIAVMTWICYRGIEISARVQYVLLGFEVDHPAVLRRVRARQGLHGQRRAVLADPAVELVQPVRPRLQPDDRPGHADRDLHLLGLGHGGLDQ